jgi:hypothetical protein
VLVLVEPPVPAAVDAGMKEQPFASRHDASVTPEQVPSGVPVQFGDQTQPEMAAQPWNVISAPHAEPAATGVPLHEPRSMHPEVFVQSPPARALHGSGVPEQVPMVVEGPVLVPFWLPFLLTPGQSLQALATTKNRPHAQKTRSRGRIHEMKRREEVMARG